MGTITKNFSYKEFEVTDFKSLESRNVIATFEVRDSIKALVENVLQPLRNIWGKPLYINSGYRCRELNALVGGASTSQHVKGEAADVCPFGERNGSGKVDEVYRLAKLIINLELPFDQIGLYRNFVHVSHKLKGKQRGQVFYDRSYNGKRDL